MTLLTDQISKMLKKAPYELNKKERDESLLNICRSQIKFHIKNCDPYKEWYLKNNFKTHPLNMCNMKNRDTFSRYIYRLHEIVNKM